MNKPISKKEAVDAATVLLGIIWWFYRGYEYSSYITHHILN